MDAAATGPTVQESSDLSFYKYSEISIGSSYGCTNDEARQIVAKVHAISQLFPSNNLGWPNGSGGGSHPKMNYAVADPQTIAPRNAFILYLKNMSQELPNPEDGVARLEQAAAFSLLTNQQIVDVVLLFQNLSKFQYVSLGNWKLLRGYTLFEPLLRIELKLSSEEFLKLLGDEQIESKDVFKILEKITSDENPRILALKHNNELIPAAIEALNSEQLKYIKSLERDYPNHFAQGTGLNLSLIHISEPTRPY